MNFNYAAIGKSRRQTNAQNNMNNETMKNI